MKLLESKTTIDNDHPMKNHKASHRNHVVLDIMDHIKSNGKMLQIPPDQAVLTQNLHNFTPEKHSKQPKKNTKTNKERKKNKKKNTKTKKEKNKNDPPKLHRLGRLHLASQSGRVQGRLLLEILRGKRRARDLAVGWVNSGTGGLESGVGSWVFDPAGILFGAKDWVLP